MEGADNRKCASERRRMKQSKEEEGIGKETARGLAKRGARVILACRNVEAADKVKEYRYDPITKNSARNRSRGSTLTNGVQNYTCKQRRVVVWEEGHEIITSTGNSSVVVKKLDLSSLESVRQFANDVNRSEQRLDVLVHNAGYANTFSKQVTGDGLEITMATNHYGPFLLTHLLIVRTTNQHILSPPKKNPSKPLRHSDIIHNHNHYTHRVLIYIIVIYYNINQRFHPHTMLATAACSSQSIISPFSDDLACRFCQVDIQNRATAILVQNAEAQHVHTCPINVTLFPSSDLLKRSSPSRIVIVASELYRLAHLDLNHLNPVQSFPAYLYYVSKYANIVFSLELSRRLENTGTSYFP
uniref:Uncharacterized protein n=1 Tax=Timema monikensis TaxID=170555 RepID=A0A7R9DZV5_9NEOP|nr:unnamed protein product [Timema monikensis]